MNLLSCEDEVGAGHGASGGGGKANAEGVGRIGKRSSSHPQWKVNKGLAPPRQPPLTGAVQSPGSPAGPAPPRWEPAADPSRPLHRASTGFPHAPPRPNPSPSGRGTHSLPEAPGASRPRPRGKMHVNKANRGRQERRKKATEKEEGWGGGKRPSRMEAGCERDSRLTLHWGYLEGGCSRIGDGGEGAGAGRESRRKAWRRWVRGRERRGERRRRERELGERGWRGTAPAGGRRQGAGGRWRERRAGCQPRGRASGAGRRAAEGE